MDKRHIYRITIQRRMFTYYSASIKIFHKILGICKEITIYLLFTESDYCACCSKLTYESEVRMLSELSECAVN